MDDSYSDKTHQRAALPRHANSAGAGSAMDFEHENEGYTYPSKDNRPARSIPVGGYTQFWPRFTREGKRNVDVGLSIKKIIFSSWINIFFLLIPFAWISHFLNWSKALTFTLCFFSIIPLENMFEFGGEELSIYLGKSIGDLVVITLNNVVEATLALVLLEHCELRLLQATIVGVVLLHLLLIPGVAFITGGARIWEQDLHPQISQLNHTLLTVGVMSLLLPAAFFSAVSKGTVTEEAGNLISDETRHTFLHISRGLAVILLLVYVAAQIFLHNPPRDDGDLRVLPNAPEELLLEERRLINAEPEINQYVLIIVLLLNVAILAPTAEFLVDNLEHVRESGKIKEEWFGLFILPLVSFSGDGVLSAVYFLRSTFNHYMGRPTAPNTMAKAQGIDLSIQFTLFWMPVVVLLGWWTSKPLTMLFDFFEVSILLGACFLVNYVTADAKTNWAEGFVMVAFYAMIALTAWFYSGQPEVEELLTCLSISAELAGAGGALPE